MPEGELFPGPNHWIYYIPVPLIAAATIYLDIAASGYSNPIIFFISTVAVPMLFIALASGLTGKEFLKFFGIGGTLLSNIAMFLIVGGMTILFYVPMSAMSMMYAGTWVYAALQVVYLPMSAMALTTLSVFPVMYLAAYYMAIAIGEEIIKYYGLGVMSDYFYQHTRLGKALCIVLGIIVSWGGWVLIHTPGNPAVVSVPGLTMAFILSAMWFLPFYILAENLFDPAAGITLTVYSLAGTIGGHFTWDMLIEMSNFGYLSAYANMLPLVAIAAIGGGLVMLAHEYWKRGLPIFGYIHLG